MSKLSQKEIEYFSEQLPDHLCVMPKPKYLLVPSQYQDYYELVCNINGVITQSRDCRKYKDWLELLGVDEIETK